MLVVGLLITYVPNSNVILLWSSEGINEAINTETVVDLFLGYY